MATFNKSAAQVRCAAIEVTVPSITDPDSAVVAETVTGVKLGDIVIAGNSEALPTNCHYTGAYVSDADEVTFTFTSVGGNVTGAAADFNVQVYEKS